MTQLFSNCLRLSVRYYIHTRNVLSVFAFIPFPFTGVLASFGGLLTAFVRVGMTSGTGRLGGFVTVTSGIDSSKEGSETREFL